MSIKEKLLNDSPFSSMIHSYLDKRSYKLQKNEFSEVVGEIAKYKDVHKGKRCFIIGTGPSLKPEDLDILMEHNEITFAPNRIFEIFDKTDWRPTYYACQDFPILDKYHSIMNTVDAKHKFYPVDKMQYFKNEKNVSYFILKHKDFYPKDAEFSFDVSDFIAQGFTITYGMIQLAVYMGFKEIYLLGIDHNYSITLNEKGIPVYEDVKDFFEGSTASNKGMNLPRIVESTVAYITAQKVAEKSDFKIFNATRGGKLEAFPRVDFDSLF